MQIAAESIGKATFSDPFVERAGALAGAVRRSVTYPETVLKEPAALGVDGCTRGEHLEVGSMQIGAVRSWYEMQRVERVCVSRNLGSVVGQGSCRGLW